MKSTPIYEGFSQDYSIGAIARSRPFPELRATAIKNARLPVFKH